MRGIMGDHFQTVLLSLFAMLGAVVFSPISVAGASRHSFQGLDSQTVLVLGTNGNLWLEHAPLFAFGPGRQQVDGNVQAFQGLDSQTVLVLGTNGNLWLEHAPLFAYFGRPPSSPPSTNWWQNEKVCHSGNVIVPNISANVIGNSCDIALFSKTINGVQYNFADWIVDGPVGIPVAADNIGVAINDDGGAIAVYLYGITDSGNVVIAFPDDEFNKGRRTATYSGLNQVIIWNPDETVGSGRVYCWTGTNWFEFSCDSTRSPRLVALRGQGTGLIVTRQEYYGRQKVDGNVQAFHGLDSQTVLVLGTNGNLWLEHAPLFAFGTGRTQVDGNAQAFQALDSQTVLVLGTNGNLWLEHAPLFAFGTGRTQVDGNVQAFQGLDSQTVLVLGTNGNLWLEHAPLFAFGTGRPQVDGNVQAFHGLDSQTVLVLGTNGNLWLEHAPLFAFGTGRPQVDGNVPSLPRTRQPDRTGAWNQRQPMARARPVVCVRNWPTAGRWQCASLPGTRQPDRSGAWNQQQPMARARPVVCVRN
jgi:hypothetical protein